MDINAPNLNEIVALFNYVYELYSLLLSAAILFVYIQKWSADYGRSRISQSWVYLEKILRKKCGDIFFLKSIKLKILVVLKLCSTLHSELQFDLLFMFHSKTNTPVFFFYSEKEKKNIFEESFQIVNKTIQFYLLPLKFYKL